MPREFLKVATVADLADGEMMLVTPGGEEILLARIGGRYFAIDALCTHAFGMLDQGTLSGFEVECPIHEGRFDLRTGQPTREPAEEPVQTYAVQVQGDDILIGPRLLAHRTVAPDDA